MIVLVKFTLGECVRTTRKLNICSGDALVPSGPQPSPEAMLTQFYAAEGR